MVTVRGGTTGVAYTQIIQDNAISLVQYAKYMVRKVVKVRK